MKKKSKIGRRRPRAGYLLVTVIVMIAVASLMLARLASTSMRVASASIQQERDMRHRWAVISLSRFSLDRADQMTSANVRRATPIDERTVPSPALWKNTKLGGQTWKLIISDESAKLNLKRASEVFAGESFDRMVDDLLFEGSRLNPVERMGVAAGTPALRWEHWLSQSNGRPASSPRRIATATRRMTLWGGGRLNLLRCEKETMDILWRELFGRRTPPAIDGMRIQSPPPTTDELIRSLSMRESQANLVKEWFTTESDCYAVWIFCESDHRVASTLYIDWAESQSAREHRGYEY